MNIRRFKPGTFVELECRHFVAEGLGLSYFADESLKEKFKPHVFFIWGVLPGERFIARLAQVKSKVAHGVLARLDELPAELSDEGSFAHETWALRNLAPDRDKPPCDNYLRCGGCRMQHMSYERTLEYKLSWLRAQLERNKVEVAAMEFHSMPEETRWHYRNHVQVHINKYGTYGFYEPVSYRTRAFPDHGCLIFEEKKLRDSFPRYPVEVRAARIRLNTDGEAVFTVLNSKDEQNVLAKYSVRWPEGRKIDIKFPVTGFFQANLRALPHWLSAIRRYFELTGLENPRVLELFSGFGFISRMQSLVKPMQILAMDILSSDQVKSVEFAQDGVPLPDTFTANFRKVDLFLPARIPDSLLSEVAAFGPQVLLINPPRAGLAPETWLRLREGCLQNFAGPIIYSSCDAATMARDLATFTREGYRVEQTQVFDFFPWTHHYETVSYLVRP
ncbi:MAG: class I SAM-dependent RNA methyltransferase [Spirochaetota bacterium]